MQIIKLDATESTNTYLKDLAVKTQLDDFTIVTTRNQTLGRGQLHAKWESEKGKNLTFSILKKNIDLSIDQAFLISICVSLAILDGLEQLGIPNLRIKWPNDILSGRFKIGGILIENMISGSSIRACIIGFGLNVNQEVFKSIPNAASLKQIVGKDFDLDFVFYSLIEKLNDQLNTPLAPIKEALFEEYHTKLFKIGERVNFKIKENVIIKGAIIGISNDGKLIVDLENDKRMEFGLKEIQLLY